VVVLIEVRRRRLISTSLRVVEVEVERVIQARRQILIGEPTSSTTTETSSPPTPVPPVPVPRSSKPSRRVRHRSRSSSSRSSPVRSSPPDNRNTVPPAPSSTSISLLSRGKSKSEDPSSVLSKAVAGVGSSSESELVEARSVGWVVGRSRDGELEDGSFGEDFLEISSEGRLRE